MIFNKQAPNWMSLVYDYLRSCKKNQPLISKTLYKLLNLKIVLYNCIKKFWFVCAKYCVCVLLFCNSVMFEHMLGWRLHYSFSPEMFVSIFAGNKSNSAICIYGIVSTGEGKSTFSR